MKVGGERGLFCFFGDGEWVWESGGERIRQELVEWWQQETKKEGFAVISTPHILFEKRGDELGESLTRAHKEYMGHGSMVKVAELAQLRNFLEEGGVFDPKVVFADRAHAYCEIDKVLPMCISSLQFILKIPKILDFESQIVLITSGEKAQKRKDSPAFFLRTALDQLGVPYVLEKGSRERIEVRMADPLGRLWAGPFLEGRMLPDRKAVLLIRSSFGTMERVMALLLEKTGGTLPLWLANEQVRLILVSKGVLPYATHVLASLRAKGVRAELDQGEEKLGEKLYRAHRAGVPLMALIGEREEREKTLTIRRDDEQTEMRTSLDELISLIMDR